MSSIEKQQVKILDVVLNGSPAKTLKLLDKEKAASTSEEKRFSLLFAYLNVGDFERARELAAQFSDNSIYSDASKYVLGRGLHRAGRQAEALEIFEALVADNQQSPNYWLFLGRVQSELGNPVSAHNAISNAYTLYPESGRITIGFSQALGAIGQRNRAAEVLFTYLEEKPKDARALTALAEFYVAENNFYRAEQLYKIVHELQADNLRIAKGLASVQLQAGRPSSAIQTLSKIIAQEPSDTEARLMHAKALEQLGDLDAAILEYETVLKLDAENEAAKIELHRMGG